MTCKHCGAKLPSNAAFCDVCGKPVERQSFKDKESKNARKRLKDKKRQPYVLAASILAVILIVFGAWYAFYPKTIQFSPNLHRMKTRVSEEEFEKVEIGMTYKEVCDIVGGKGKLEEIFGTMRHGSKYYAWPGELMDKKVMWSDMRVSIDNSTKKVDWISSRSIWKGEEVYKNEEGMIESRVSIKNEQAQKINSGMTDKEILDALGKEIKNGMTYKEVVEVIGKEGVLSETDIVKSLHKDDKYEERYNWVLVDEEDIYVTGFNFWFINGKLQGYEY